MKYSSLPPKPAVPKRKIFLPVSDTHLDVDKRQELPKEAKAYVEFLEKQLGHEIQFVSTGAEREKFVLKGAWL